VRRCRCLQSLIVLLGLLQLLLVLSSPTTIIPTELGGDAFDLIGTPNDTDPSMLEKMFECGEEGESEGIMNSWGSSEKSVLTPEISRHAESVASEKDIAELLDELFSDES